jgi:hypothetical protein
MTDFDPKRLFSNVMNRPQANLICFDSDGDLVCKLQAYDYYIEPR